MDRSRKLKIGDLVIFQSASVSVKKNQIGIVIGTQVMTDFQETVFENVDWYVVLFGSMKLIVNNEMIEVISGKES